MYFLSLVWVLASLFGLVLGVTEAVHLGVAGCLSSIPVIGAVAFALGLPFAWPAGLVVLAYGWAHARFHGWVHRWFVTLVFFAILFALACWTIEPWWRRMAWVYFLFAAVFALGGMAMVVLSREHFARVGPVGGLLVAAACLTVECRILRYQYGELHSLCLLGAMVALLPVASPLARRAQVLPRLAKVVLAGAPLFFALLWLSQVDQRFPWWRFDALHHGRIITATTRIIQKAADFDGDGYSPWAWGGDCDDRDPHINPLAPDPPGGGDSNCNGVDLDDRPHTDLVIAPPVGRAALASGRRRVMVFVLDSLRADHFDADHMPRMDALAHRGLRLSRCYAGGAETQTSVPLMVAPNQSVPGILPTLRQSGVRLVGGSNPLSPLPRGQLDVDFRSTDLAAIVGQAVRLATQEKGSFLFLSHPMAIHAPYQDHPELDVPATPSHVPRDYKSAVRYTDMVLGRLWDELEDKGLAQDLTWIVTADHGEAFGEAGLHSHGSGGADAVLRVPCAMWGPGVPALTVDALASHRGLPATLLGLYGLEPESAAAEFLGRSWLRWIDAPTAKLQERVVIRSARVTSGRLTEGHLIVLLDDRHRFISAPEEGSFELFDVGDQNLSRNLGPKYPDLARQLRFIAATVGDMDGYPVASTLPSLLQRRADM